MYTANDISLTEFAYTFAYTACDACYGVTDAFCYAWR